MNLSVERLPECKARLSAEIPSEVVSDMRRKIVSAYASQAKVPGFRPGKVPTHVIEKRFAGPIEDELKDRLARSAYGEAQEKEALNILGIASVEREQFENDGSYMLAVEVVTEPEVEIAEYKGIPVEISRMEVTDEMVDGYLRNMRKQQASAEKVDRAAAPGDLVEVDYTATLDGQPLEEKLEAQAEVLARGQGHQVEAPEEGEEPREFIPGLASAVEGLSAGESKSFDATFGEDFPVEVVAGQTVSYEITVTSVQERKLPELNDEFARSLGVESVDSLRDAVRQQFQQQQDQYRNQVIDNQILEHLNEEMTFDLPQHIVFNETQRQVNEMVSQGVQEGMTESDIQEQQEDLVKNAETRAKNNVRTMFILEEIAEKEGLGVTEDEVSQRVVMMAHQQQRPVKKLARELRDNNGFDSIRRDILVSKTIEFLRSNATVSEVDPPENEG